MVEIALSNDWEYEFRYQVKSASTGVLGAATGLAGITAWLSLEDSGTAIAGTTISLTERSAKAGFYYGVLDAPALDTALSGLVGRVVYECSGKAGDAEVSRPLLVAAVRRPAVGS